MKRFFNQLVASFLIGALLNSPGVGTGMAAPLKPSLQEPGSSSHMSARFQEIQLEDGAFQKNSSPVVLALVNQASVSEDLSALTQRLSALSAQALRSFQQDQEQKYIVGPVGTAIKWTTAAVSGLTAATGFGILFMNGPAIAGMLWIFYGYDSDTFNASSIGDGVAAGLLSLPDMLLLTENTIDRVIQYTASRKSSSSSAQFKEEKGLGYYAGGIAFTLATGAFLLGKPIIAFYQACQGAPIPPEVLGIVGATFFSFKGVQAFNMAQELWEKVYQRASHHFYPPTLDGEAKRKSLRHQLLHSFRKATAHPEAATPYWEDILSVRKLFADKIAALSSQTSAKPQTEIDQEILHLRTQASLLELYLLLNFADHQDATFVPPPPASLKERTLATLKRLPLIGRIFDPSCPPAHRGAVATAAVFAGVGIYSNAFGWSVPLYDEANLPWAPSIGMASVVASGLSAHFITQLSTSLIALHDRAVGKNPAQYTHTLDERMVDVGTSSRTSRLLRTGADGANLLSKCYTTLLYTGVGAQQMGMLGVPYNNQLPGIIGATAGYAASEHMTSGPLLQQAITRFQKWKGGTRGAQALAEDMQHAYASLRSLKEEHIIALYTALEKVGGIFMGAVSQSEGYPAPVPAPASASLEVKGGAYVPPALIVDEEEASGGSTQGSPPRPTVPVSRDGTPPPASLTHSDSSGSEKSSPEKDAKTLHQPRGSQEGFQMSTIDSSSRRPSPSSARSSTSSTGSKKGQGPLSIPLLQGEPPTE